MTEPTEAEQLVETDSTPAYIDGPQPGEERPTDAEVFRLDEAAAVAEQMFAAHGEGA